MSLLAPWISNQILGDLLEVIFCEEVS